MTHAVPILMYHSIDRHSDPRAPRWTLSPTLFAEHMDWLAEHDYHSMTVSDLVAARAPGMPLPPRTLAITFDDGLRDFLTGATPVLQRYGFAATLYVVTGYVGKTSRWSRPLGEADRPMLSWSELRSLSEHGIECGAHTHSHPQLDLMPPAGALGEILRSKSSLEDHLGRAVQTFAYPHGYACRTTRKLVRQAGFTSACRVRHALSSTEEDCFALSRIIMTSDIGANDLASLLAGESLPIAPPPDRFLATGWRLVRRVSHRLRHRSKRSIATADCEHAFPKDRPEAGSCS